MSTCLVELSTRCTSCHRQLLLHWLRWWSYQMYYPRDFWSCSTTEPRVIRQRRLCSCDVSIHQSQLVPVMEQVLGKLPVTTGYIQHKSVLLYLTMELLPKPTVSHVHWHAASGEVAQPSRCQYVHIGNSLLTVNWEVNTAVHYCVIATFLSTCAKSWGLPCMWVVPGC